MVKSQKKALEAVIYLTENEERACMSASAECRTLARARHMVNVMVARGSDTVV